MIRYEQALDAAASLVKRAGLYALVLAFLFVGVPLFMAGALVFIVIGICVVIVKGVFA